MIRIPLTEAQLRLPELIASLQPGEEVQIFSGDVSRQAADAPSSLPLTLEDSLPLMRLRTVARLIGELLPRRKPRQPGSAIGTLTILSQDETHLEDFHDYMP